MIFLSSRRPRCVSIDSGPDRGLDRVYLSLPPGRGSVSSKYARSFLPVSRRSCLPERGAKRHCGRDTLYTLFPIGATNQGYISSMWLGRLLLVIYNMIRQEVVAPLLGLPLRLSSPAPIVHIREPRTADTPRVKDTGVLARLDSAGTQGLSDIRHAAVDIPRLARLMSPGRRLRGLLRADTISEPRKDSTSDTSTRTQYGTCASTRSKATTSAASKSREHSKFPVGHASSACVRHCHHMTLRLPLRPYVPRARVHPT
ncbi:hypothetical protein C8Q79DRAFT_416451 [Trametes meyenii]|nr:hypothetical protein C8Q79DRAFT_416451 [Trametes meyenii]